MKIHSQRMRCNGQKAWVGKTMKYQDREEKKHRIMYAHTSQRFGLNLGTMFLSSEWMSREMLQSIRHNYYEIENLDFYTGNILFLGIFISFATEIMVESDMNTKHIRLLVRPFVRLFLFRWCSMAMNNILKPF